MHTCIVQLDRLVTGKYLIEAKKPDVFFHPLKNVDLSPSHSSLTDISVTNYHVCGTVNAGESSELSGRIVVKK